jgi:hypothetical protein
VLTLTAADVGLIGALQDCERLVFARKIPAGGGARRSV